jgi:hypothetical protein
MRVRNQSARHAACRRARYALLQPGDADRKVAEEEGNCDFRLNFGGKPFDDLINIFSGILPNPGIDAIPQGAPSSGFCLPIRAAARRRTGQAGAQAPPAWVERE